MSPYVVVDLLIYAKQDYISTSFMQKFGDGSEAKPWHFRLSNQVDVFHSNYLEQLDCWQSISTQPEQSFVL